MKTETSLLPRKEIISIILMQTFQITMEILLCMYVCLFVCLFTTALKHEELILKILYIVHFYHVLTYFSVIELVPVRSSSFNSTVMVVSMKLLLR